jgi:two-component system NarL family sensor kinase
VNDSTPANQTALARDAGIGTRAATRLAWSLWAVCVVLIGLALLLDFMTEEVPFDMGGVRFHPGFALLTGVLSLAYPAVGALIASRLPANPIGWIFCGLGLVYALQRFTRAYADYALLASFGLPWGGLAAWFSTWVGLAANPTLGVFLMLLFPGGRLPSRRWRVLRWATIVGAVMTALGFAFMPGELLTHRYVNNPFEIVGVVGNVLTTYELFGASRLLGMTLLLASLLAALLSVVLRMRRARGDERQQLKWFLFAAAPLTVLGGLGGLDVMVAYATTDFMSVFPQPVYMLHSLDLLLPIVYAEVSASLLVPICTYVAILRYNLYDIDVVINRTLAYSALTASVVGIYVLAVGGLGALFQAQGNLGISLVATGLVAILFQPLRGKLQRGVNRLMYGERDDPYAVISRLGRRLEATLAPEAVLPTLVETIAQALKLPYVAILLKEGEGFRTTAAYGSPRGEPESLPLVYQREEIGRLVLSPRAPGERFSDADRRLLEDLARQAEVAVHAVRLTDDLQRSRERLVATREEERRRLRRDLHDGLGPTLASLALRLDAARKLVRLKPEDAEQLLARMKDQTQDTVGDVRRLVYGLRPPALDDLGLVAAILQQAESHGFVVEDSSGDREKGAAGEDRSVSFSLEAPEDLPSLPAAVEVAAYRIAQEAITNVARHAHAKTCCVRLSVDRAGDVLELEVTDDGVGMPEDRQAGVGMSSMRERAEELGGTLLVEPGPEGGTRVLTRLPLPASEEESQGAMSSWNAPSASS